MNPELIALLDRLVTAHESLAAGINKIADALHYREGDYTNPNLASQIDFQLGQISSALENISDALPKSPEE